MERFDRGRHQRLDLRLGPEIAAVRVLPDPGTPRPVRAAHHQELRPREEPHLCAPKQGLPHGVQAEAVQRLSRGQVGVK